MGTWDSQPHEVHAGDCLTRVTLDWMRTLAGVDRCVLLFRETREPIPPKACQIVQTFRENTTTMVFDRPVLFDNHVPRLFLMVAKMKQTSIKYIFLALMLLPIKTIAVPTIPSDEAKQNFASCVITLQKAWAECYHHLYSDKTDTTENGSTEKTTLAKHYTPPLFYRLLPTFNSPDYTGEPFLWETTSTELTTDDQED